MTALDDRVRVLIGEQLLTILTLQIKIEELETQMKESKKSK